MKRVILMLLAVALAGCGRPVHRPDSITVESVLCTADQVVAYFANPAAGLPKPKTFPELDGMQQFIIIRLRHDLNQRFGGKLRLSLDGRGLGQTLWLHGESFGDWDSHVTPMGRLRWGYATGTPVIVHEWLELDWK